ASRAGTASGCRLVAVGSFNVRDAVALDDGGRRRRRLEHQRERGCRSRRGRGCSARVGRVGASLLASATLGLFGRLVLARFLALVGLLRLGGLLALAGLGRLLAGFCGGY